MEPATFVPVHAAGDGAWNWHLVATELRARGHDIVAIDLPADDESADLDTYAQSIVGAVAGRRNLVLVAHSFGGFTAPLVCTRVQVRALVMVSAMVPAPGERPADWWERTGYREATSGRAQASDDVDTYYHDVPRELADEAIRRARNHPSNRAYQQVWPLAAWPNVRTHALVCTEDRLFPATWMRGLVRDRLGIVGDEIASGHCPMLSRPAELADRLVAYAALEGGAGDR